MSEEKKHWGPATKFGVDRTRPNQTFDTVEGQEIVHGQDLVIHWPEIEESRKISIEASFDRHGTRHSRAYFEVTHHGAVIKVYLRDVQHVISVQLHPQDRKAQQEKQQALAKATPEELDDDWEYRTHEMTCGS